MNNNSPSSLLHPEKNTTKNGFNRTKINYSLLVNNSTFANNIQNQHNNKFALNEKNESDFHKSNKYSNKLFKMDNLLKIKDNFNIYSNENLSNTINHLSRTTNTNSSYCNYNDDDERSNNHHINHLRNKSYLEQISYLILSKKISYCKGNKISKKLFKYNLKYAIYKRVKMVL